MTAIRLSHQTLSSLRAPLLRPPYTRSDLSPGILHFGLGNFHRAHQAYYLHNLFSQQASLDFGIIAAGTLASELPLHTAFHHQQGYYTLLQHSPTPTPSPPTPQIIASILDYLPPTNSRAILTNLVDPAIRVVTLTITEGAYYLDSHGRFDPSHPAIIADAPRLHNLADPPRTVFGLLARALHARRERGLTPFTVLSCDNIEHNGRVARDAVVGTAHVADDALAEWIASDVCFPSCMVDRITPAADKSLTDGLENRFGVCDALAVQCEEYVQWVVEEAFGEGGRPQLERVGVEFVDDVAGWEAVKIRVLNGGHAILGYATGLLDYEFGFEGMGDATVRALLDKVEEEEILPGVQAVVTGLDVRAYYRTVCERFANAGVRDSTRRLCMDGSNRQPKFIVPSVRDALKRGGRVDGLALSCALWCRYCYGVTEGGRDAVGNDECWEELKTLSQRARFEGGGVWLDGLNRVYGNVGSDERFRERFGWWLGEVWRLGVRRAIEAYLKGTSER